MVIGSKALARVVFCVPVLMGLWNLIWGPAITMPDEARLYQDWYLTQPLEGWYALTHWMALAGFAGICISAVGLCFFHAPSRYFYIASVLLAVPGEVTDVPTLFSGTMNLMETVTDLFVGASIVLMFTQPIAAHFAARARAVEGRDEKKAR